jgi:hypothetical protein
LLVVSHKPEQHSVSVVQATPRLMQHCPWTQDCVVSPVQQSWSAAHAIAFGMQVQVPKVQVPVQQSDGALQAAPRYEQTHVSLPLSRQLAQTPSMHESPSGTLADTQTESTLHGPPTVEVMQNPKLLQLPVPPQQSASLEHPLSSCPHAPDVPDVLDPQPAAGSAAARTIRASDARTAESKPSAVVRRDMRRPRPAARAKRERASDPLTLSMQFASARSMPAQGPAAGALPRARNPRRD